jgi:hypothetical protein
MEFISTTSNDNASSNLPPSGAAPNGNNEQLLKEVNGLFAGINYLNETEPLEGNSRSGFKTSPTPNSADQKANDDASSSCVEEEPCM